MDTDDLIPGDLVPAHQDAELYNVLLRASAWADNYIEGRLGAHVATESTRARVDRDGLCWLTPANVPVRQVQAVAYGSTFQNMNALASPSVWVEDARGIAVALIPQSGSFFGALQFGSVPPPGGEIFIQYQYVAGYANTTLTASAAPGTSSLAVADGTGFQAPSVGLLGTLGGSVARIWEPGVEEAVALNSAYVSGSKTLTLANALQNAHAAGAVISEFPAEVRQAIICHAVGLLLREDVSAEEPFSGTPFGPTARMGGGKSGGLVDHAMMLLEPYRRTR